MVSLYMYRYTGSPTSPPRDGNGGFSLLVRPVQSRNRALSESGWTKTAASEKSARFELEIVNENAALSWLTGSR